MNRGLRISVLGEVRATLHGRVLDLGGLRQRAVLALLVVAQGGIVSRDRLVDALWAGSPPPSAQGTLQAYVSRLRRGLEPGRAARSRSGFIVSEGSGYALRIPDEAVDAWRFEHVLQHAAELTDPAAVAAALDSGLTLWRGPAFDEYVAEPWALPEAARLAELYEVARERLLAARLGCGEDAVLVPELEALIAQEPLREERWRLLALALYRSHRQADALNALRRARQTLAEQLGVDPGSALRALEGDILAQASILGLPTAPAPVRTRDRVAAAAARDADPAADALVDRDQELADLDACLVRVLRGQAGVVLVEGPAGIGKSRLLTEVRRLAINEKVLTLTARGSRQEKDYGFGAVRQLFERLVVRRGGELLTGAAALAAAVFDLDASATRRQREVFAILHGLCQLTLKLAAEGPLLLAVDDVQWCDTGSLRFLAHLARRMEGLPVLITVTLRTGEPHDNGELLAELAHDPATFLIHPKPLTAAGVADLVHHALGEPADKAFATACHAATSGNPLLLQQLLRALETSGTRPHAAHASTVTAIGSRAISELVLTRLARLPANAVAAARAIAVLGDGAALPDIAAFMELPDNDVADAIAPLVRVEIIRDRYPFGFVHPLVGEAVYRDVLPGERQLHHERAARILHAAAAPPEQTSAHLLLIPQRGNPWVVDVLRAAAGEAANRGAADAATTYLTRSLQEPPTHAQQPEILLELGRAETLINGPAAAEHLRQAYETLPDPARRASAALLLARILVFAGGQGQATAFARRAATELPAGMTDERQGLVALERDSGFMHGLDPQLWRAFEDQAVIGDGPGARMLAATLARETAGQGKDCAKAVALARFAVADDVLLDAGEEMLRYTAAIVLHLADEDVSALWDAYLARAHERGSLFSALATHLWRGFTQWEYGDLREAQQSLATAVEQSETWGLAPGAPQGRTFLTGVLLDLGDAEQARVCLERMRGWVTGAEGTRLLGETQARVLMAEGRYDEALTSLDSVRHLQPSAANPAWWPWALLRVQALHGLGELSEAEKLAGEQLLLARTWGTPSVVGRTLRLLGEVRGAQGLPELQEAVALLSRSRARLEHARALHALAVHGPAHQAGAALRHAHTVAERCEAAGLLRSITEELNRTGR
ncbi:BTAD domain-containing putative transcriptional regulator [Actinacidiphila oryziradicis]|uniref:BTAD domain-containing putative transcriptional regulator n=1 Tax=Actinacidiphila oryziradicis TaxID=2571141 RepID=UPI0023F07705|nr:BTAD domain-containing putative transcriptional regulator [Actinacidiphila oryziradicis]MCW2871468.1 Tetratricopeptide 4 [Actinacidiphila oryziradicis]